MLAERGRTRVQAFFSAMNTRLADNAYVAGPRFSIADITALIAIDFAGWAKIKVPDELAHLRRWYAEISARPSAKA